MTDKFLCLLTDRNKEKNRKNSFDVCSSFRALCVKYYALPLRASSYVQP